MDEEFVACNKKLGGDPAVGLRKTVEITYQGRKLNSGGSEVFSILFRH
jgi:hypothetical protein